MSPCHYSAPVLMLTVLEHFTPMKKYSVQDPLTRGQTGGGVQPSLTGPSGADLYPLMSWAERSCR